MTHTTRIHSEVADEIQGFVDELESRVPGLKEARMALIGDVHITVTSDNWQVERVGFKDNAGGRCPYSTDWANGFYNTFLLSWHWTCGHPGAAWPQPTTGPVWEFAQSCREEHRAAIEAQQDAFWDIYVAPRNSKVHAWKEAKSEWLDNRHLLNSLCSAASAEQP